MTRADFYILNGNTSAHRFSCSIANKAWLAGKSVYIITRNTAEAVEMDDLLWTYQDISFVPHATVDAESADVPVLIGWMGTEAPPSDIIINLTDSIPEGVSNFDRVIEIIAADTELRSQGRERYKCYREMGFDMFDHTINIE